jgi:hypothetical protein
MNKTLFIATTLFFIIVNSTSYWESDAGSWSMLITLGLVIVFGLLLIGLFHQSYLSFKEKFVSKTRLLLIFAMAFVLISTVYRPFGLINFNKFDETDILFAEREGGANCSTTFKLMKNNKFIEHNVCFGTTEIKGTYILKKDTIYFLNVDLGRNEKEYFKFAVIKHSDSPNKKIIGNLVRYKDFNDTTPRELWITKNELAPKLGQDK